MTKTDRYTTPKEGRAVQLALAARYVDQADAIERGEPIVARPLEGFTVLSDAELARIVMDGLGYDAPQRRLRTSKVESHCELVRSRFYGMVKPAASPRLSGSTVPVERLEAVEKDCRLLRVEMDFLKQQLMEQSKTIFRLRDSLGDTMTDQETIE